MNKKELFAEPVNVFKARRIKVIGIIFLFLILLLIMFYIGSLFNLIPTEDLFIILLLALGEIPIIFILANDHIFAKRLIIYDDGLYTKNKKRFISFEEINYIKIDSVFLNSIYLKINFSDDRDVIFPFIKNDLSKIRKIFAKFNIPEKKPQIIRRWSMNRRITTN